MKHNRLQITAITEFDNLNSGRYLLQNWIVKCSGRIGSETIETFIHSTKTNSPTPNTGITNLPPIGNSFLFIETIANNFGQNVYCSFEQTDIIHISIIKFYYIRFSGEDI